jgi:hypothetical protein
MRDPRYSSILFEIERKLHEADRLTVARGLTLTDSNIRSLLVRAIHDAEGKAAKSVENAASDKDRFLAEARQQLAVLRAAMVEECDQPDIGAATPVACGGLDRITGGNQGFMRGAHWSGARFTRLPGVFEGIREGCDRNAIATGHVERLPGLGSSH